jgi:hypothetical protein
MSDANAAGRPQGLKPSSLLAVGGTAEAMPFPNGFMILLLTAAGISGVRGQMIA